MFITKTTAIIILLIKIYCTDDKLVIIKYGLEYYIGTCLQPVGKQISFDSQKKILFIQNNTFTRIVVIFVAS